MGQKKAACVRVALNHDAYKPGDTVCGNVTFDDSVSQLEELLVQVRLPLCGFCSTYGDTSDI